MTAHKRSDASHKIWSKRKEVRGADDDNRLLLSNSPTKKTKAIRRDLVTVNI